MWLHIAIAIRQSSCMNGHGYVFCFTSYSFFRYEIWKIKFLILKSFWVIESCVFCICKASSKAQTQTNTIQYKLDWKLIPMVLHHWYHLRFTITTTTKLDLKLNSNNLSSFAENVENMIRVLRIESPFSIILNENVDFKAKTKYFCKPT